MYLFKEVTMADIKEIVEDENKIGTVIADDIEFRGKLVFKESLKIKGFFEGTIGSDGHLIIGRESTVSADISAGIVTVDGITNGKIKASKLIELNQKSKTNADLFSPELYVENGSIFNGTCIMNDDSSS
jgi:cytoskeletal protein CcmA (bactofilin family)